MKLTEVIQKDNFGANLRLQRNENFTSQKKRKSIKS